MQLGCRCRYARTTEAVHISVAQGNSSSRTGWTKNYLQPLQHRPYSAHLSSGLLLIRLCVSRRRACRGEGRCMRGLLMM